MKNPLTSLFSPKEMSFIVWFMAIFLGSASVLALLGLLPSEFTEQSDGRTLSQKIADGVIGVNSGSADSDADNTTNNDTDDDTVPTQFSESALGILQSTNTTKTNTTIGASRANSSTVNSNPNTGLKTAVGLPTRLIIPSIAVDTKVYIPKNTSIAVLDADLTKGPVYYPGSGTINTGNMFIFGHSTGHAVVINKAYKVFNDLKNLSQGDTIYIESEGKRFTYRVRSVDKVDKDETMVTFDTKTHLLTLSTCNSFGSKSDRFVVVAEFVN